MIATEYVPLARRTLKELPRNQHFIHMALGLCGEIGEFIDAIKKFVIYGKGVDPSGAKNPDGSPVVMLFKDGGVLDTTNLTEEAGDDFWYAGNLLEELAVHPLVLQRAIYDGMVEGVNFRQKAEDQFEQAAALLAINFGIATVAMSLANAPDKMEPGSSDATKVVEALGSSLGALCGLYGLDPALAMELNIKKLAKRYGEKYSDVAALNRDTGAEREVLEGGAA